MKVLKKNINSKYIPSKCEISQSFACGYLIWRNERCDFKL